MASMKDKIENGQIFERLVVERYKNSIASGIRINEISAIETRAKSLIKAQNEHYKKNYEAFVNQETFRQISLRRTKDTSDNTTAVSLKDYDACRRIAANMIRVFDQSAQVREQHHRVAWYWLPSGSTRLPPYKLSPMELR